MQYYFLRYRGYGWKPDPQGWIPEPCRKQLMKQHFQRQPRQIWRLQQHQFDVPCPQRRFTVLSRAELAPELDRRGEMMQAEMAQEVDRRLALMEAVYDRELDRCLAVQAAEYLQMLQNVQQQHHHHHN
jgi:hypothetical protein